MSGDKYDAVMKEFLLSFGVIESAQFRVAAATLLRDQVAEALKPVEEENARLRDERDRQRGAAEKYYAEVERLKAQLEEARESCAKLHYEIGNERLQAQAQKLAEARGLLERLCGYPHQPMMLQAVMEVRAFLAESPAAPPRHEDSCASWSLYTGTMKPAPCDCILAAPPPVLPPESNQPSGHIFTDPDGDGLCDYRTAFPAIENRCLAAPAAHVAPPDPGKQG